MKVKERLIKKIEKDLSLKMDPDSFVFYYPTTAMKEAGALAWEMKTKETSPGEGVKTLFCRWPGSQCIQKDIRLVISDKYSSEDKRVEVFPTLI